MVTFTALFTTIASAFAIAGDTPEVQPLPSTRHSNGQLPGELEVGQTYEFLARYNPTLQSWRLGPATDASLWAHHVPRAVAPLNPQVLGP